MFRYAGMGSTRNLPRPVVQVSLTTVTADVRQIVWPWPVVDGDTHMCALFNAKTPLQWSRAINPQDHVWWGQGLSWAKKAALDAPGGIPDKVLVAAGLRFHLKRGYAPHLL